MSKKMVLHYLNLTFSLIFFLYSSSILLSETRDYDILDESIYNKKILKLSSFFKKIARTHEDIILHLGYDSPYMCSTSLTASTFSVVDSHSDKAFHIVKIPEDIIKREKDELVVSTDVNETFLSSNVIQAVATLKKGKVVGLVPDTVLYELDPESLDQLQKYFDYIVPYYNEDAGAEKDSKADIKDDGSNDNDKNLKTTVSNKKTRKKENYLRFDDSILEIMDVALMNDNAESHLYLKEGDHKSLELTLDILSNSLYSSAVHNLLNVHLQMNYNPANLSTENFFLAASLLSSQINKLKYLYSSVANFEMTLTNEKSITYISLPTHLRKTPTIEERVITEDSSYYKKRMKLLREGKAHYASMNTINMGLFWITFLRNDTDKTLFVQISYTADNEFAFYTNYVNSASSSFLPISEEDDNLFDIHVNNKTFPIKFSERYNIQGKELIGFNNVLDLKSLEFDETEELSIMFSIPVAENLSTVISSSESLKEGTQLEEGYERKIFIQQPLFNVSTDMIYNVKATESYYIYTSLFSFLTARMYFLEKEKPIDGKYRLGTKFYNSKEELTHQISIALKTFGQDIEDQYKELDKINKKSIEATHHVSESLDKALNTIHDCYDFFSDDDVE